MCCFRENLQFFKMFSASPKNAGGCQAECDRAVYNMDVQFRLLGAEALKTAQELLGFKGGIVALSGKVTDHGIPGGSGRKPPHFLPWLEVS